MFVQSSVLNLQNLVIKFHPKNWRTSWFVSHSLCNTLLKIYLLHRLCVVLGSGINLPWLPKRESLKESRYLMRKSLSRGFFQDIELEPELKQQFRCVGFQEIFDISH